MKKITLLLTISLLLSASFPPPASSWYNAAPGTETSLALFAPPLGSETGASPTYFDTFNFDTLMNGFYVLSDATFTTSYSGLVKLSGTCTQGKPSNVGLFLVAYGVSYPLAHTSEPTFAFSYTFPAGTLKILGVIYDLGRYDPLKCNVLFEMVK